MNNQQLTSDLKNRIESLDPIADEPLPAGWSRRNWVQREAIAFGDLVRGHTPAIPGEESA